MVCDTTDFVDGRRDLILTQYRESEHLLWMIYELAVTGVLESVNPLCAIPDTFDIDIVRTRWNDQLTIIGKWLGWPRCHCRGKKLPVFGFECPAGDCQNTVYNIQGFCSDAVFFTGNCAESQPIYGEFCFGNKDLITNGRFTSYTYDEATQTNDPDEWTVFAPSNAAVTVDNGALTVSGATAADPVYIVQRLNSASGAQHRIEITTLGLDGGLLSVGMSATPAAVGAISGTIAEYTAGELLLTPVVDNAYLVVRFGTPGTITNIITRETTDEADLEELYRKFLLAKIITDNTPPTYASLTEAAQALFGAGAWGDYSTPGRAAVYTGRALTTIERSIAHLYRHVLPVSPGIDLKIYENATGVPFGFGAGWGEFCTADWAVPVN